MADQIPESTKIKGCPFCAGSMEDRGYGVMHVTPGQCILGGYAFEPAAWNTRAAPSATIPADIAQHVRKIGKVEWGQTPAHDADGHGRHIADSVRLTAANFGQTEDQHMHGLWLEGTETVLCHTGTTPNAPMTTQTLAGAWNWLVDQALATPASDGGKA